MEMMRVAGLLLALAAAAAGGDCDDTARAVLEAHEAGDGARLARLASLAGADAWLVADALVARGADAAAAAYAAAVPDRRTRRDLARYLATDAAHPGPGLRATLRAARTKRLENNPKATLVALALVEPDASVVGIRMLQERAAALRDLGREWHGTEGFVAAAWLAHEIGWRRRRNFLLRRADRPGGVTAMGTMELRERLDAETAVVRYGVLGGRLVAVVVARDGSDVVPLDAYVPAPSWILHYSPTSPAELVTGMHRRFIEPLELGDGIRRLVVHPPSKLPMIPSAGLDPDRSVVFRFGKEKKKAEDDADEPKEPARGVVAVSDAGGVRFDEALGAGSVVLGPQTDLEELRSIVVRETRWRAVHLACAYETKKHAFVMGDGPFGRVSLSWFREESEITRKRRARLGLQVPERGVFATELMVISGDGVHRLWNDRPPDPTEPESLVSFKEWRQLQGQPMSQLVRRAPRVLVPCWQPDSDATRALMLRFYALWNPGDGKPGIPAAEALRRAQAYIRGQERWRHPYYWAGWQLWGRAD
jgi:hypothetical protein